MDKEKEQELLKQIHSLKAIKDRFQNAYEKIKACTDSIESIEKDVFEVIAETPLLIADKSINVQLTMLLSHFRNELAELRGE